MAQRNKKMRDLIVAESNERQMLIEDVRRAEMEWTIAHSRFHDAVGSDHVDYAIYCLEAAERKLAMMLRKAKWHWNHSITHEESRNLG